MFYTHVEIVKVKPGQMDETLSRAEAELLPLYRNLPGFVAYTIAKTDEVSSTGLSIWQTREQAEHAAVVRDDWMKKGLGALIDSIHDANASLPFLAFSRDLVAYASATPVASGRSV